MSWSNGKLPVFFFLHYKRWDWPCRCAGSVIFTLQRLAVNQTRNRPHRDHQICAFWADSKKIQSVRLIKWLQNWKRALRLLFKSKIGHVHFTSDPCFVLVRLRKKCWTQECVILSQNAALRLPLITQTWKPETVNAFYSPLTKIKDIHVSTDKLESQFGKNNFPTKIFQLHLYHIRTQELTNESGKRHPNELIPRTLPSANKPQEVNISSRCSCDGAPDARGTVRRCQMRLYGTVSTASPLCLSAASRKGQNSCSPLSCGAAASSGTPDSQPDGRNSAPADTRVENTKHLAQDFAPAHVAATRGWSGS